HGSSFVKASLASVHRRHSISYALSRSDHSPVPERSIDEKCYLFPRGGVVHWMLDRCCCMGIDLYIAALAGRRYSAGIVDCAKRRPSYGWLDGYGGWRAKSSFP